MNSKYVNNFVCINYDLQTTLYVFPKLRPNTVTFINIVKTSKICQTISNKNYRYLPIVL